MELRCTKCGRELPSEYWFKLPGICVQCFPALSSEELSAQQKKPITSSEPERPFPSPLEAFVLLPLLFLVFLTLASLLKNSLGVPVPDGLRFMLYYLVSFTLLVFFSLGAASSRGRFHEPIVSWNWPPITLFLQIIAIVLVTYVCTGTMASLLVRPVPHTPGQVDFFDATTKLLLAPVLEETLFRGIVLDSFLKRMKPWKAILASSVLFALFHVQPTLMLVGVPIGLLLGWLYLRYRSILPTIAAHAIINGAGLSFSLVASAGGSSHISELTSIQTMAAILGSLCALVATAFWFRFLDKKITRTPVPSA